MTSYKPPDSAPTASLDFWFDITDGFVEISVYSNPDECQGPMRVGRFRKGAAVKTISIPAEKELAFSLIYNDPAFTQVLVLNRTFKFVPQVNAEYTVKMSHDREHFYYQIDAHNLAQVEISEYGLDTFVSEKIWAIVEKWCAGNRLVRTGAAETF